MILDTRFHKIYEFWAWKAWNNVKRSVDQEMILETRFRKNNEFW
jgi:hypothetical protein